MPSEVRFAEVRKLLESHGSTLDRTKGSHHHFRKAGSPNFTIPVHHGKVKPRYVHQIEKVLGIKC